MARVVLTFGLHGSASTWVYNVARELMAEAFGADAVASRFANTADDLRPGRAAAGRHLVCKTHGFPGFGEASLAGVTLLISVRDPRDAVVSLMRRFEAPFEISVGGVAQDCRYALGAASPGTPVLRYEDRFFEVPATVPMLAKHLGVLVSDAAATRIFAGYGAEAVRRFAAGVPSLPPERIETDGKTLLFDRVTQIHHTHLGDGRVGKWREQFSPRQQAEATRLFAPFLARFGYPAA